MVSDGSIGASCPRCATPRPSAGARFCSSCGFPFPEDEAAQQDPLIGTVLPGDYVLLELVGVGGMGRVYRAEQRALGRTVAVKVIHPHLLGDEASAHRFTQEARAASRLNHPNSLAVIDFGRHGSLPYLVTEFLRGRDLARVMHEDGLFSIRRATNILCQVLAALEEAHHAGIVHRDLKVENVVLETLRSGEDFVKVVDFGLAKLGGGGPEHRSQTAAGTIFGSPEYMAPEQARGEQVDGRADLYACGVMLFYLLTGRLPFDAETPIATLMMQITHPVPDPVAVAPERRIPRELADVVVHAMAKDPADRFQTAAEFAAALRANPTPVVASAKSERPCGKCRSAVPAGQRFCGNCGAPQEVVVIEDEITEDEPIVHSVRGALPSLPLPFTMRDDTLAELELRVLAATGTPVFLRIVADTGVGKTRLLKEAAVRFGERSIVSLAGPDPWTADVGFWALRCALRDLAGTGTSGTFPGASGDALAGLQDVFELPGAPRLEPAKRRSNAAAALRWAVQLAHARTRLPVLLLIDDYEHIDGASRNAFEDVTFHPFESPLVIVAAHAPRYVSASGAELPLTGLPARIATELLQGRAAGRPSPGPSRNGVLFPPLYVDQLVRYTQEGGTNPPDKLADIVAKRVDHLPLAARLLLQAIAVTGSPVTVATVERVLGADGLDGAVDTLVNAGMIAAGGLRNELRLTHPLLGEVALASAPAEVRRELHQHALEALQDLPLEARALLGYQAQAGLDCLMLLEAVAGRAGGRDDSHGEILALRRALEVARREMLGEDLDDAISAAVVVGRKLGDALVRAGRFAEAEGILREALSLADPMGAARESLEALLKQVSARRRSG